MKQMRPDIHPFVETMTLAELRKFVMLQLEENYEKSMEINDLRTTVDKLTKSLEEARMTISTLTEAQYDKVNGEMGDGNLNNT